MSNEDSDPDVVWVEIEGAGRVRFSRKSSIRIDQEGHFWHEDERVEHLGMSETFARWITRDAESGRYQLRNGIDWCWITVDDAPLVVRAAHVESDGRVTLWLSDGQQERLDASTLSLRDESVPYCLVREGTLSARFGASAAFTLLEHAQWRDGQWILALANERFALPPHTQ
ncbi:MAG: DUF1285 domain-containing protein [Deltaproteobacteria bacterium]|nr:DUF1285 domain-containing protein [Deltaproteobacteria bacterium]